MAYSRQSAARARAPAQDISTPEATGPAAQAGPVAAVGKRAVRRRRVQMLASGEDEGEATKSSHRAAKTALKMLTRREAALAQLEGDQGRPVQGLATLSDLLPEACDAAKQVGALKSDKNGAYRSVEILIEKPARKK